jgi:2-iminobutanoate/2-iminopropanoate deaminase
MKKNIIRTDKAPAPIGPYNQAVAHNGMLFISGQIPINPKTGDMLSGDIEAETKQVMDNLQAILMEAGMDFQHVMKATIFLADMNDFPKVNGVYGNYFAEGQAPARETVQVSRLPKDARVEISMIAIEGDELK